MDDDALAPVIAIMLILAVIVTFFSVWNAVYIPSMKAQAEISHLRDVEKAFLHLSSDIDAAASLKRDASFSEPVPLGGGDFIFNDLKSAGMIRTSKEPVDLASLQITNNSEILTSDITLVNVTYKPLNNFWQEQGYSWSSGYVSVSKGMVTTPLEYLNMEEVQSSRKIRSFAATLLSLDTEDRFNDSGNCSKISLTLVNFSVARDHAFFSGNGAGTISVTSQVFHDDYYPEKIVCQVNNNAPEPFKSVIWERCNESFRQTDAKYFNVNHYTFDLTAPGGYREASIEIDQNIPVMAKRHIVPITISVF